MLEEPEVTSCVAPGDQISSVVLVSGTPATLFEAKELSPGQTML